MRMVRATPGLGLLTALVATAVIGAHADGKTAGGIPWGTSFAKGAKQAAKLKKPMLVDFYATWCPPCRAMMNGTYRDRDVVTRAKRFVPVLIDTDKQSALARKYRIDSLPTVVFFGPKGQELVRAVGYHDQAQMLKLMDEAEQKLR